MREIKFRAFYKPAKAMFYMDDLVDEEHFEDLRTGNYNACEWSALMQYTGLKDKNGVEIYEGDIIKYKNVYEWKVNPVEIQPVVYEQGMFTVPGAVKFMGKDCEVIGNIYEHPELLRTSS